MLERREMDRDVIEIVGIDSLVPEEHLLQKIDRAMEFSRLYEMVEPLYCEDNGRPNVDTVVLFKMVLTQHLCQLPHLPSVHSFQELCQNGTAAYLEGL